MEVFFAILLILITLGAVGGIGLYFGLPRRYGLLEELSSKANYKLARPVTVVGRNDSSECHLPLPGDDISRRHAQIIKQNGIYYVQDLQSTNGTYLDGQKIVPGQILPLHPGNILKIGGYSFAFSIVTLSPRLGTASAIPAQPNLNELFVPIVDDGETKAFQPPAGGASSFEPRGGLDVVGTIGKGGMGIVYKALDSSGNAYAIKVLHEVDQERNHKFAQEGQIGKSLNHPHIVRVLNHSNKDGQAYIVMEYINGPTLRDVVLPGKPLPVDYAVAIAGQVAEALEYAHRNGVIHRDIKPENLLLDPEQGLKVADFGIARMVNAAKRTSSKGKAGTPYYMSYEQAKGEQVDFSSDIYSLGVVLYEMLTGELPFFHEDDLKVVEMHLTHKPLPPSYYQPHLPAYLEQAVMRALEKDRFRRIRSASEFMQAIGYNTIHRSQNFTTLIGGMQPTVVPFDGSVKEAAAASSGRSAYLVQARLRIEPDGREIPLSQAYSVWGREQLLPGDESISREQFAISLQQDRYLVQNLSRFGTYLNGNRLQHGNYQLQSGDQLRAGNVDISFLG